MKSLRDYSKSKDAQRGKIKTFQQRSAERRNPGRAATRRHGAGASLSAKNRSASSPLARSAIAPAHPSRAPVVCNRSCPSSDANFAAPIKLHDSRRRFRKSPLSPRACSALTSTCLRCSSRMVQDKVVFLNTIAAPMPRSQRIADSSKDSTSSAEMRSVLCAKASRLKDRLSRTRAVSV